MSRSLFLRELKRLAPLTLAAAAIPAVLMSLLWFLRLFLDARSLPESEEFLSLTLGMATFLGPWLVGAGTFAPERESGAAAFLAALPGSRGGLLATRLLASLLLSVLLLSAIGAVGVLTLRSPRFPALNVLGNYAAIAAFALALQVAAWFASLSLRRSLSAFVAGPFVVVGVTYSVAIPWSLTGIVISQSGFVVALGLLCVAAIGTIGWAFVRERPLARRHPLHATWKPALAFLLGNAALAGATSLVDAQAVQRWVSSTQEVQRGFDNVAISHKSYLGRQRWENRPLLVTERGAAWLPANHFAGGYAEGWAYSETHGPDGVRQGYLWDLNALPWAGLAQPAVWRESQAERTGPQRGDGVTGSGKLGRVWLYLVWIGDAPWIAESTGGLRDVRSGRLAPLPEAWALRADSLEHLFATTPQQEVFCLAKTELARSADPAAWRPLQDLFPSEGRVLDVLPTRDRRSFALLEERGSEHVVSALSAAAGKVSVFRQSAQLPWPEVDRVGGGSFWVTSVATDRDVSWPSEDASSDCWVRQGRLYLGEEPAPVRLP